METNVNGTFNMLEAARISKIEKFIFASSGAPIGELLTPPIHEELPAHPVSPYGASKLAGEGYCSVYNKTFGIKTIALRFGNVYGPRSKHKASVVAKFIKLALDGQTCEIYGTGKQTRDFIYISDLIEAVVKASQADVGGEIFQIATNKESTVNEIVEIIKDELAKIDVTINIEYGDARLGDLMRNFSDTTKAKNILGWEPKMALSKGIKNTIEYFL
jgi:UDP-glucose 4-epimerase